MAMKRAAIAAAFVVVVLAAVAVTVYRMNDARNRAYDFSLTDQDGAAFRLSQDRGHVVALFFGYTHCLDACPATLAHLAQARKRLASRGDDVRVVFVTIDPHRDTPSVMKRYLAKFDPSFVGVTGSESQLVPVYKAYHVWYEPLPKSKAGLEQLEEHTATITIVGPGGHLKGYADQGDSIASLADNLRKAAT